MAHANSMDDDELEENWLEEDYYAFLNLPRDATPEDIINAYRRQSKLYHPDKHCDPDKKKDAEILFSKTKKAYEVLIDPHKRAIYDTLGVKGLETEGWELVQRTKTPQEIREEYEQLARERDERRLQQRTNPKGTINVGIDATELFETYEYDDEQPGGLPHLEINNMTISQSIDAPLTINDNLTLSGSLATQNGTGNGAIACSLRHILSPKMWTECEVGAGNGLVFSAKFFRTLTQKCFSTIQGSFHFTPNGIKPGLSVVLARQMDKHTVGYLTWKGGRGSLMNSMIVWDTNKSHLAFSLQFGLPSTFIMMSYTHKFGNEGKLKGSVKVGTLGTMVEYGCEKKISQHSVLGASVIVGVPSGVTLKLRVTRASQNYVFPVLLSEDLLPSAVFYGTVAPLMGWYVLKVLVINPYQERQKRKDAMKAREANADKLAQRKREATASVSLMKETYSRITSQEEAKGGLLVIQALYGKTTSDTQRQLEEGAELPVVDVTIPLQCLVKDSRLILPESSKSNLSGFYDPCLGEDKCLYVRYRFRNLPHEITIKDEETLRLPKESHLLRT